MIKKLTIECVLDMRSYMVSWPSYDQVRDIIDRSDVGEDNLIRKTDLPWYVCVHTSEDMLHLFPGQEDLLLIVQVGAVSCPVQL